MQVKVLTAINWLLQNAATLCLLAGFAVIVAAGFTLGTTVGLFVLGGVLIAQAVILFIPEPAERG